METVAMKGSNVYTEEAEDCCFLQMTAIQLTTDPFIGVTMRF